MKSFTPFLLISFFLITSCNPTGSDNNEDDGPPRTIVFASQEDGTFQIFSMREDGSGVRQLTDHEFGATNPAWSPNGSRIAYARSFGSTGGPELWVMDADGSNQQPLVFNPRTGNTQFGNHPAWSPDGTKLAFDLCLNCEIGGSNFEVFVADLQAGSVDTLTSHQTADTHPTWSPDGESVAFASNRDYFDADTLRFRQDLYAINTDGSDLQRLTEIGQVNIPRWSPSGINIAYARQRINPEIFLLDLSTNNITTLTNLKFVGGPLWNSRGNQLLISGTTLNGKRVLQLITTEGELINETELNLEGTREFDWHTTQ